MTARLRKTNARRIKRDPPGRYQYETEYLRGKEVVIFQIAAGHDGGGSGIRHMRVKIPGQGGYLRRSTKTVDRTTAIEQSMAEFRELEFKHKFGIPMVPKKFMVIAEELIKAQQKRVDRGAKHDEKLHAPNKKVFQGIL